MVKVTRATIHVEKKHTVTESVIKALQLNSVSVAYLLIRAAWVTGPVEVLLIGFCCVGNLIASSHDQTTTMNTVQWNRRFGKPAFYMERLIPMAEGSCCVTNMMGCRL